MAGASTWAKKGEFIYCNEIAYLLYSPEYMKCLHFVSVWQFHVHNAISFVFLVRNTIINLNIYSKATKLLILKGPNYIEDNDSFLFIKSAVHIHVSNI